MYPISSYPLKYSNRLYLDEFTVHLQINLLCLVVEKNTNYDSASPESAEHRDIVTKHEHRQPDQERSLGRVGNTGNIGGGFLVMCFQRWHFLDFCEGLVKTGVLLLPRAFFR